MLSLALLALMLDTRPMVTPAMMLQHHHDNYDVMEDRVTMQRTRPDDFIVRFSNQEDLEWVLSTPELAAAPFVLRWRRWSCLIKGSMGALWYRALVGMKGIPSQACSTEVAQAILGSSGAKVEIANLELFVTTWCVHPDLIPDEMIMVIPEPEEEHDDGSPLYLWPWEIIHSEVSVLPYLIRLHLVEFQD